jgi:hypothetical protein
LARQGLFGLLQGMRGPELRFLQDKLQILAFGQLNLNRISSVSNDDGYRAGMQRVCGMKDMLQ